MKTTRMRRLRNSKAIRSMVKEFDISVDDLIYPIFVVEGQGIKSEIPSMPDVFHYSLDMLEEEIKEIKDLGIKSIILFGVSDEKDEMGSGAYSENGIVQRAVRKIKEIDKTFFVITDVCMCQYTSHGHCGVIDDEGYVNNDETIKHLAEVALSHVVAGADMVAPSDMMDFRVDSIRKKLDENGYENKSIMSYSAKYASSYYGPFRDAAHSAPGFGDRKTYQMDYRNRREALREVELDISEGADIVMVKPALAYLDIIRDVRNYTNLPVAAYNVSGEYSMLKLAIDNGILGEEAIYETMISIKRAGADLIITYFAKYLAKKLKESFYE
ncbi:MAG: porphobilinogen synthase [Firmicutes bacterium]|jgi:porphobilinogen synthase|nr:porphobilinogen synthase [Bacillota bacterium]